ncbi:methyltransferase domain-containing protein [Amycolatopsis sp. FBCC-B4732]|uniref:methyltransferase domain-containing protein n=1 Tax=Amycolatopsis sp. FBCC-B4732 TaxID=3079339 RepID=UPI001FF2DA98|nr:methyltransferase domain-containing protein [Amycolatopsis sp. FBCC-B4732]UOX86813.1 methyltransferase domain-containing protein [Amycolatopsis sp. FBCC-B4732]
MTRSARLRRRLVEHLLDEDVLHAPEWIAAFRAVPRHVFLPRFFVPAGGRWAAVDHADPGWLETVYSRDVLVTQLDDDPDRWALARRDGPVAGTPTSSSSMPSIMAIMLEELRVRDGDRVLEIGTGTGYNAALLSHRCGAGQVSTVDIDPVLVAQARERLAAAGYHPACAVGDGALGFPAGVLFDRVLCTAAVSSIPLPWLAQTKPGGLVVTTLNRPLGAGLVRLVAGEDGSGQGRVLARDGRFMPLRAHRLPHTEPLPMPSREDWEQTRLPMSAVLQPRRQFEFFAGLALPGVHPVRDGGDEETPSVALVHPDGSWVRHRKRAGADEVAQGGPRALWELAEAAYVDWCELDKPDRDRFGVTVTGARQEFWLDEPGGRTWPLG